MKNSSLKILKIGLAITFLWIGILIFKGPEAWGAYLQPWAADLLPVSLKTAMLGTAFLDIAIGILFLIDSLVWLAAILGVFHLTVVLIVSGVNAVTVRDIGLLSASLAVFFTYFPSFHYRR